MENRYAIEIVEEAVRDRKAAVVRVQQLSGVKAALPMLIELSREARFSDLRIAAVTALGGFDDQTAVNSLIETLGSDKDWHVRSAALQSLAKGGSREAIAAVKSALQDRAYGVREDARRILESRRERSST